MKQEQPEIQIQNRQRRIKIKREAVMLFCAALLRSLKIEDQQLSVVFAGLRMMQRLNHRYRNKNYATDVLSFSYAEGIAGSPALLGEIVVAPEVAVKQADRYGVSLESELRKLLLHGVLHLAGYDHETDAGQMMRMQQRLMQRKFFKTPPFLTESKEMQ